VKATFSTLVRQRDPRIAINLHVIDRVIKRFAPRVQLAVAGMDPELAYDIYDEAHRLPATYTELELNTDFGYQINGNLIRDNDNLVICFKDTTPYILKILTTKEYKAMLQIKDRLPPHNHIIQITELVQVKHGKQFAIMPILPTTLEGLLKFTPTTALRFWNQMASALEAFHKIGFAHNDVKPANICLGPTGDFVLIDLGSVAKFGAQVASTTAYHPKVAKDSKLRFNIASASLDWWMLAAVLTEKACGLEWGGTSNPSTSVVQQFLEEKLPKVWEELHLKLLQVV
jgi:serine/threonine protein kinase